MGFSFGFTVFLGIMFFFSLLPLPLLLPVDDLAFRVTSDDVMMSILCNVHALAESVQGLKLRV